MYICNTFVSHGGEKGVGLGDVWPLVSRERAFAQGLDLDIALGLLLCCLQYDICTIFVSLCVHIFVLDGHGHCAPLACMLPLMMIDDGDICII